MSGASATDRPGLCAVEAAVSMPGRPFDVLLVDDTSRLSRHQPTAMQLYERLNFAGVRVVAVGQGIDSLSDQADVLMAMHGLIDHQYVKELAKKTHRGLEGKVLRGCSPGGRTFGYRTLASPEGMRLEIKPDEALIVRRIFEMAATGLSLKKIARALNGEHVPTPRPRSGRQYATWCPTAIREMLRRRLYGGTVIWNTSRFVKRPGTNKRVRRERPPSDWRIVERPELQIISQELWQRVQEQIEAKRNKFGHGGRTGLLDRALTSPYLLTGFLKCGVCGANLAVVTGRGPGRISKYGCPQNFYRGACSNDLKESREQIEIRLLARLQDEVLRPEVIDFTIEEFIKQLEKRLAKLGQDWTAKRDQESRLQSEIKRLADAVAQNGASIALINALNERERELKTIAEEILVATPGSIRDHLTEVREFVTHQISDVRALLNRDVTRARGELAKHVQAIRMCPAVIGQDRFYVAEGEWNLLGGFPETGPNGQPPDWRVRMVAGARNHQFLKSHCWSSRSTFSFCTCRRCRHVREQLGASRLRFYGHLKRDFAEEITQRPRVLSNELFARFSVNSHPGQVARTIPGLMPQPDPRKLIVLGRLRDREVERISK
jgi:DNA invertase Pin-like site-specific DNA recombinase